MLDHRIRLRHLRCFLETARLGSLTVAAQTLNVSQPAASKTLRELEDILGLPLFDRTGRRLRLTAAGQVFQQHAGSAMIELDRAQDLVRNAPRRSTRVTVGALPTAATTLLPQAALAFRDRFPECLLRVTTGPNWLLMSQLREGALDLVVGRMAGATGMEGLTFRPLYSERIAAIVRPGHPLLGQPVPMGALADYPLILPPPGAAIAGAVRSYLARQGIAPGSQAYETVSLAFGRRVVQGSDAVWFISLGVVSVELAKGELAELTTGEDLPAGPAGISMRGDGMLTPEQAGFVKALEAVAV